MKAEQLQSLIWGVFFIGFTTLAFGETCEGDKMDVPDSSKLASVQKLAESGDGHAQARLGMAYLRGKGVEHDVAKAILWLEKSASAGNSEGQYLLGQYYAHGKSEGDHRNAAKLLKRSADQGCLPATFGLGVLTKEGRGVKKNAEQGLGMIQEAASGGYSQAQWMLGLIKLSGDGVSQDVRTGLDWIKRAADSGDSVAQLNLASLYLEGKVVKKDVEMAVTLLNSVLAKKDEQSATASYLLGWMYMEGKEVPVDRIRALELLIFAADSRVADSEARVRKLTNELPKQKLLTSCSLYMTPQFELNSEREYLRMNQGESVVVLRRYAKSVEAFFPDKSMVGFISRPCLD